MARHTFFSFHYKPDVSRAWVARNSWVTKVAQGEREDAGFFDKSVFEATQKTSDDALKRFLKDGLRNTTVTCVLVGEETALRRWVRYELFQSFIRGNGILAVRIHSIGSIHSPATVAGANPLDYLAFTVSGDKMTFRETKTSGWTLSDDVGPVPLRDISYELGGRENHTFSTMFSIYDWEADKGYDNLGSWIKLAADKAGR